MEKALQAITVDEETGEVFGAEELEKATASFEEKAESVAVYIKSLTSRVKEFKEEEKALKTRREAVEKRLDWYKGYLTTHLVSAGRERFETVKVKLSFRPREVVDVLDKKLIPQEYMKPRTTYDADKTAIMESIKAGNEVPGAVLKTNMNLQVK